MEHFRRESIPFDISDCLTIVCYFLIKTLSLSNNDDYYY